MKERRRRRGRGRAGARRTGRFLRAWVGALVPRGCSPWHIQRLISSCRTSYRVLDHVLSAFSRHCQGSCLIMTATAFALCQWSIRACAAPRRASTSWIVADWLLGVLVLAETTSLASLSSSLSLSSRAFCTICVAADQQHNHSNQSEPHQLLAPPHGCWSNPQIKTSVQKKRLPSRNHALH